MIREIKVEWFDQHDPCYDPRDVLGKNWGGTIMDILNSPDVSARDKIWAATRKGLLTDKQLRVFAISCAKGVLHLMKDKSKKALQITEKYINGSATREEMNAARNAAGAAASAAARAAVWEAAWADRAAAWADRAAAWADSAAARAAASAAAWDAARNAAWEARAAAENKQVELLKSIIG